MKCAAFALSQPETIYLLLQQITWISSDFVCDGNTNSTGAIQQVGLTPALSITAGAQVANNNGLALNAFGILTVVFNGASSLLQVNNTLQTTGDAGAGNMGGFTLSAAGTAGALPANIQAKESIVFAAAHDAATRLRVIRHLAQVGNVSA